MRYVQHLKDQTDTLQPLFVLSFSVNCVSGLTDPFPRLCHTAQEEPLLAETVHDVVAIVANHRVEAGFWQF